MKPRLLLVVAALALSFAPVLASAANAPSESLVFAMPKGWTLAKGAHIGIDMVGGIAATPGTLTTSARAFVPAGNLKVPSSQWREWMILRDHKPGSGPDPKEMEKALLADLDNDCTASKHVRINAKTPQKGVLAGGYHLCAQMKSHPKSQIVMYKVLEGENRAYMISRHRRAGPVPAEQLADLAKSVPAKMGHWIKWYASVRLRAAGEFILGGKGSAFALNATQLLTNEHVIHSCREVRIAGNGTAEIKVRDKDADLAVLEVDTPLPVHARLGDESETRLGMPVMVAGYPLGDTLGNSLTVTTGTINGHGGLKGKEGMVRFDAAVQKGNSGGPLLGQSGNVIGVVRGILDPAKAQNVNFAITVPVVEAFLNKHGIAYQSGPPGAPLSTPDLAELAGKFTVQVECWR